MNSIIAFHVKNIVRRIFGLPLRKDRPLPNKIVEYRNVEGFLQEQEAITLFRYASKLKPPATIVEIGSWKGKSTFCLAQGLRGGRVFAIDPFDASGDPDSMEIYKKQMGSKDLIVQFKDRMRQLQVDHKIEILQGYSTAFKNRFKSIDMLFIDGDHSIEGCKTDFELFARLIVRGGYVLFHDYDPKRTELGPTWVINNLIAGKSEFRRVEVVDSIWVGQRQ